MLHILNVGPDYKHPHGGIAKLINTYSSFFEDFRFISTMRALKKGKESKLLTGFRMFLGLFKMSWMIVFRRYRIIHIHTASGISFLRESFFLYLASFLGAKTIFHMHSGSLQEFYEAHPKFVGRSLRKADRIITIANVWEKYLKDKGHKNVITIGNPINRPDSLKKNDHTILNVLFLGLIGDNKGIWDILGMINNHKEDLKGKIRLTIGGNGEVDRLLSFLSNNNLSDIVEYVGWIDGERKAEILSNSDIYLQPSYQEALGIAILEAMSYKIPVIATNVGGIPEIINDGVNGYLIAPGDQDALYLALKKLLESPEKRLEFGENGSKIAKNFYPDVIKTKLTDLYQSL